MIRRQASLRRWKKVINIVRICLHLIHLGSFADLNRYMLAMQLRPKLLDIIIMDDVVTMAMLTIQYGHLLRTSYIQPYGYVVKTCVLLQSYKVLHFVTRSGFPIPNDMIEELRGIY